ncbi:hypothetical protein TEA_025808 [Camellia sinensis var. sinensis]|uniref:Nuclear pore complex protein n=1 Tax=Camellia sinensis var. sinensis TaxID=542762 RepID=A0A4S4E4L8_CAMSN|nr:hypothetical protein TEA_025808 [Camellia sinensis var. sinensis]
MSLASLLLLIIDVQMNLMMGDIPHLLDVIWSWISPSEDEENVFRPHGDPQMIRFGAHLVLVLRYLLVEQMKDAFREKIMTVGDLILHMYAIFLFSKHCEELVGIYASQLAHHRCIDLFVHMMELRLNSSVHVKYKIFLSTIEYLPFSPGDDSKGSFEEIVERVLSRSREIKPGKYDKSSNVAEQHRLQSLQKAMVIQWLCFTPPSTINDAQASSAKLLLRALLHIPITHGWWNCESSFVPCTHAILTTSVHELSRVESGQVTLGSSAEPTPLGEEINHSLSVDILFEINRIIDLDHDVSENLREFQDWSEYYSCDATYHNWLKVELENVEVSPLELSVEEKQRAIVAAKETLNSSFSQLLRKENPWLVPTEDHVYESVEPLFLELHAIAMLCLPSGECMCLDATLCATLLSALYSSVSEEVVLNRQLMMQEGEEEPEYVEAQEGEAEALDRDNYCIEVVLRCLATDGDGLGPHELNDGGILATVIAAGFKDQNSENGHYEPPFLSSFSTPWMTFGEAMYRLSEAGIAPTISLFTQCFESARQAGLLRYSYSADRDLYVAGDLYENDVVRLPPQIPAPQRRPRLPHLRHHCPVRFLAWDCRRPISSSS